jgi:phosphoribosyl 1,2-cyclic phosphodiesterase
MAKVSFCLFLLYDFSIMAINFYFLGSGSRGNCTLVDTGRYKFLIDAGLGLRRTIHSLSELGRTAEQIDALILTHTHVDHANGPMLRRIAKTQASLFCRPEHEPNLFGFPGFQILKVNGKIHSYPDRRFEFLPGLFVEPIPLSHDSPATHGFLFDLKQGTGDFRFAYVADCGFSSLPSLAPKIQGSDMIALEFNHDEQMEKQSGRPYFLINRVLGPSGHLSNHRAAGLLDSVKSKNLNHIVQLHLSQDCNRPDLALQAAAEVAGNIPLHQTNQFKIGPVITIA